LTTLSCLNIENISIERRQMVKTSHTQLALRYAKSQCGSTRKKESKQTQKQGNLTPPKLQNSRVASANDTEVDKI
jgi:hypothetical protein